MDGVFQKPEAPITPAKVVVHGTEENKATRSPNWRRLGVIGLASAGLISSFWLAHNWQSTTAQLTRERSLLLLERLRTLPNQAPTDSAASSKKSSNSDHINSDHINSQQPQASQVAELPLPPPPPDSAWVQQLKPITIPVNGETFSARSIPTAKPQKLPVLVGVMHAPQGVSSAIFQLETLSASASAGDNIGNSGWRLAAVTANGALIERQGEQHRLSVGGSF